MENNVTISTALHPESLSAIRQIIAEELRAVQTAQQQAQLLSPAEACKLFSPAISKVTLGRWTDDGLIQVQRIGGRLFYRYSDVIEAGTRLKKYKAGKG